MRAIVGLDPSMHNTGYAVFDCYHGLCEHGVLTVNNSYTGVECVLRMIRKAKDFLEAVESSYGKYELAVEVQKYHPTLEKMGINSLMNLQAACVGCAVVSEYPDLVYPYEPVQWKGTINKDIHNRRMLNKFNLAESTAHDALDAIGIADYHIRKKYGKKKEGPNKA